MTHPKLYPWLADDFYPVAEDFEPMGGEAIVYLLAFDGHELLGLYITHSINTLLWEVHHALLPHCWGKRALEVGRAFEAFMWEFTPAQVLLGLTPACNRLALRYAKQLGMTESGRLQGAYQRGGERHDLVIFTKNRT